MASKSFAVIGQRVAFRLDTRLGEVRRSPVHFSSSFLISLAIAEAESFFWSAARVIALNLTQRLVPDTAAISFDEALRSANRRINALRKPCGTQ